MMSVTAFLIAFFRSPRLCRTAAEKLNVSTAGSVFRVTGIGDAILAKLLAISVFNELVKSGKGKGK